MARDKARQRTRTTVPARIQDGTGLEENLLEAVERELLAPALEEVDAALADALEQLESGVVLSADVELVRGRTGGSLVLEGRFAEEHVGAPVMVTQAPARSIDEAEFGIVLFVAEVVSPTQMRLAWFCPTGAPSKARINYILGAGAR